MIKINKIRGEAKKRKLPILLTIFRAFRDRLIDKVSIEEFFQFEFYRLNRQSKKEFNTKYKNGLLSKKHNTAGAMTKANNKFLFYKTFNEYINRKVLNINSSTTEVIKDFLKFNDEILIKPNLGAGGIGIEKALSKNIDINKIKTIQYI